MTGSGREQFTAADVRHRIAMTIDQICAAIPTLHSFEHAGTGATLNGHAETLLSAGLLDQDRRVTPLGYVLLFALGAAAGRAGDFRDHADPAVRESTLADIAAVAEGRYWTPPEDLLVHSSRAEVVALLRRAQEERDQLVAQNLKLESRLTIAEVAIHTAIEEDRAPIWPPACDARGA